MTVRSRQQAPLTVLAAAALVAAGSTCEPIMTFAYWWRNLPTFPVQSAAFIFQVIWLLVGFFVARSLGRLLSWANWVVVFLWLPFVSVMTFASVAVQRHATRPPESARVATLSGTLAIICCLTAWVLLMAPSSRSAFTTSQQARVKRVT